MPAALDGLVVLDLAHRALIGGRMLAQLGADVMQLGPPGGSALRRTSPWLWGAHAAGKRSAVVDLSTGSAAPRFSRSLAGVDILLELEEPGRLDALGLGHEALHRLNPRLIHVSITPFGSSGPKAQWQESDLVLWAAGGPLFPSRDGDRPPLGISVPQAWLHAGSTRPAVRCMRRAERAAGEVVCEAGVPPGTPPVTGYLATDMDVEYVRPVHLGERLTRHGNRLVECEPKETSVGYGAFIKTKSRIEEEAGEVAALFCRTIPDNPREKADR